MAVLKLEERIYEVPPDIVDLCKEMSPEVDKYIAIDQHTRFLDLSRLRLSRARPEGLRNAVERMREAAAGTRARRAPVEVKAVGDDFRVVDGNSTAVILAVLGATSVPVTIVD